MELLESDLHSELETEEASGTEIPIAVNADSLATWFLPAISEFMEREKLLISLIVEDQEHTYQLMESGLAYGCVSSEQEPMRGCSAELIGLMRYRAMATPAFRDKWFPQGLTRNDLRAAPLVAFNRKDRLQDEFLSKNFGLTDTACPKHFIPAPESYLRAVCFSLGWGMVPEVMTHQFNVGDVLVELAPKRPIDVPLYWHTWKVGSPRMGRLSRTVLQQGMKQLASVP